MKKRTWAGIQLGQLAASKKSKKKQGFSKPQMQGELLKRATGCKVVYYGSGNFECTILSTHST